MTLPRAGLRLLLYLWPHRAAAGQGMLCFFAGAAMEPLAPALLQQLLPLAPGRFRPSNHAARRR